jgi:hypothetical protein
MIQEASFLVEYYLQEVLYFCLMQLTSSYQL